VIDKTVEYQRIAKARKKVEEVFLMGTVLPFVDGKKREIRAVKAF
jgi:hypothetical protein